MKGRAAWLPKMGEPGIVASMWFALVTVMVSALTEAPSPSREPACPEPAELEARLGRLGVAEDARPEITFVGDKMRVLLRGPDGATLGSREVDAPTSCAERATVAAVMVATWMGVWPTARPAPPVVTPQPPPPGAPRVAPAVGPGFGVALALSGAFDRNGWAPGIAAESSWHLAGPLRMRVGLGITGEREQAIGPGRAGYTRPALAAGPGLHLGRGRLRVEIDVGGRLGVLLLRGKGLTTTRAAVRAVPGADAGLRLLLAGKSLSPFLSAGATYWFGKETAILDDDKATAELPGWDAHLGLGLFWSSGS